MKRKSVSILLAAVMAATLFTGCGKKEEPTQEAVVEEVTGKRQKSQRSRNRNMRL